MTTTPMPQNQRMTNIASTSIDDVLKQTEIGSFFAKNKKAIMVVLALLVAAVIGGGVYWQVKTKKMSEMASVVYKFEQGPLKSFAESKMNQEDFLKEVNGLQKQIGSFSGGFSVLLKSSDLITKKGLKAESLALLGSVRGNLPKDAFFQRYFLLARVAALYEDQGDFTSAATALEEIQSLPHKIYEAKTYLDLGRIYIKTKNFEKAKPALTYVIETSGDQELATIARLYFAQIK